MRDKNQEKRRKTTKPEFEPPFYGMNDWMSGQNYY